MPFPAKPCSDKCSHTHHAPADVLAKGVPCDHYNVWLSNQAVNCRQRDKQRMLKRPDIAAYRMAIHKAVLLAEGRDHYTGELLAWNFISHKRPVGGGRRKHLRRGEWPSVDHYIGLGVLDYRICSATVNAAKGMLSEDQFIAMSKRVVAQSQRRAAKAEPVAFTPPAPTGTKNARKPQGAPGVPA